MGNKKRILLIDDDADLIASLGLRCRSIGLDVKVAHNALTAVKLMDASLPHLVCLDVNMPTGNGLAICAAMASDPVTAQIPVIIMTACCSPQTVKTCGDLCAYYVHKSGDLWKRLEPVIYELVDIEPAHQNVQYHNEAY